MSRVRSAVIFPFAGETKGGSLHSSLLLIRKLRELQIDAQAVCHGEGYALDEALSQDIPITILPAFGRGKENRDRSDGFRPGNILSMRHVFGVLHRLRPALIHLNEKRMIRTWSLPARMAHVPVLAHWRSNYTPSKSVDVGLRLAGQMICISHFSLDGLPQWAQHKSAVIYNPIKSPPAQAALLNSRNERRQALGLSERDVLIGCFSNFSERKRPSLFLEIIDRLRTVRGPHFLGLLCGDVTPPADEHFLDMVRKQDWSDRVFMPGYVHDPGSWMSACDIILAPALDEPWGRTPAEAQSFGIPIVAAAHGGHLESIDDGQDGLLVSSASPDEWVSAIGKLVDDSQFRTGVIDRGRQSAARLSIDRHVDAVIDVYRNLAGGIDAVRE